MRNWWRSCQLSDGISTAMREMHLTTVPLADLGAKSNLKHLIVPPLLSHGGEAHAEQPQSQLRAGPRGQEHLVHIVFSFFETSGNPSYHWQNKFLQYDRMGSGLQRPEWSVDLVLPNSQALVLLLFHVPQYFLWYQVSIGERMMPNSSNLWRKLKMALFEQVGFQKRFLKYPKYSVYHAANQNRGKALFLDSEQSRVDWERGTLQSCSLLRIVKISCILTRDSLFSCKSWILVNNWLTAVRSLSWSTDYPFILACLARRVSSWHAGMKSPNPSSTSKNSLVFHTCKFANFCVSQSVPACCFRSWSK